MLSLLKANTVVFKPPNSHAVWLSLACISGKYLWALPTPTTFEKVDQIFIIFKFNFHLNIKNRTVSIKYKNPQKI